jgi:hypothetical protein
MRTVFLLFLMLGFGGTAMAEDERGPIAFGEDKFKISGGFFLTGFSTSLEVGSTIKDVNKIIDVENDLGLTSSTNSARVEAYWRLGPRHRLQLGWFSLDRSGARVLDTEVEWEDANYPIGSAVESGLNLDIIPFSYAYSFIKNDRWEVAASAGFHWTKFEATIAGEAFVDGDLVLALNDEAAGVEGPFVLVGLLADFNPGPNWQVGASVQYMDLSIGKHHGSLLDMRAYAEYYIWRNVGVGVSYNYYDLEAGVVNESFAGEIGIQYHGFHTYLVAKF